MSVLDHLSSLPLIADGGVETALSALGLPPSSFPPELCLHQPETVSAIHARYREAGARILRTNSLGANPIQLAKRGLSSHVNELNWQASQLARQAGSGLEIAGHVGPLGIPARAAAAAGIDREECFRLQIGALLDGGATMIWLEGFQDLDELLLAHEVKQSLHHCPAVCSWHMTENQDHSALARTMINLQENDVEILGLDGGSAPLLLEALGALKPALGSAFTETPWAVLLSAQTSREELVASAQALAAAGAQILGGGPDTRPEDIAALAEAFSDGSES